MQRLTAHDLDVEVPHAQDALAGLAHDRERLRRAVSSTRLARRQALAELDRLRGELLVAKGGDFGLERVDALGRAPEPDYLALVAVEERLEEGHTGV